MTLSELYKALSLTSIFSVVIPLLVSWFKRKTLNYTLRVLFIYLFICLISDILCLSENKYFQNQVINTFTIIECAIVLFIYYKEFSEQKIKVIIVGSFILFMVFALIQFFYRKMFAQNDLVVCAVEAGLIMIFSSIYFIKFLSLPGVQRLDNYYLFWIVLSNLTYFSTALVFFMFGNFIEKAPFKYSILLWGMHDLINIACYILFAIGIWKVQPK